MALPLTTLLQGPTITQLAEQVLGAGWRGPRRGPGVAPAPRDPRPRGGRPSIPLSFGQRSLWTPAPDCADLERRLQHRPAPRGSGRSSTRASCAELPAARRSPRRRCGPPSPTVGRPARAAGPRRDGGLVPGRGRLGLERGGGRAPAGGRGAAGPSTWRRGPLFRAHRLHADRPEITSCCCRCITSSATSGRSRVLMRRAGTALPSRADRHRARTRPRCELRYTDFVRWQSEMLAGPEGERLWAYWRTATRRPLAGAEPADRPAPARASRRTAGRRGTSTSTKG